MLTLTIVRHAKSSWDNRNQADFDRPLNARGRRDAPRMGERLNESGFIPDDVVTSTAIRALETTHILCEKAGIPANQIKTEPRIYEATLATLQSIVESRPDTSQHLMIIGHNPGLESLCNYTDPGSVPIMTTCNIAHYELAINTWNQFDRACGRLQFHFTPKD